ncbi:MRN complex-interacting protein isoform X2 [Micropterus salmoides]|uniref:MRN complex-interacting protein isoform X2 n=1 Tax=Micropterus salmoides TaxID=27706 RepID=UPI0018EBBAE5|nr:MRN complex-interacting protein isoform X2 [Micropterus salmoides]
MVQEFHVLQCFSCQSFQVQQVKKAPRWSCKLCGEKQSLLKESGRGSAADCRRHVQKLNAMRGTLMEKQERKNWSLWKQVEADGEDEAEEPDQVKHAQVTQTQGSRWRKYLDTPEEAEPDEEEDDDSVLMDRQQLHGNNMTDRKRKRREGCTDSGGQDDWTPEQSNWSSLKKPASARTRTNSPPSKKSINPGCESTGPVSSWASFLSSDCQVKAEGEGPSGSGRSRHMGGAASLPCNDTNQTPPLARTRPLLPVSSMFESGEEFSFDEFLTADQFIS